MWRKKHTPNAATLLECPNHSFNNAHTSLCSYDYMYLLIWFAKTTTSITWNTFLLPVLRFILKLAFEQLCPTVPAHVLALALALVREVANLEVREVREVTNLEVGTWSDEPWSTWSTWSDQPWGKEKRKLKIYWKSYIAGARKQNSSTIFEKSKILFNQQKFQSGRHCQKLGSAGFVIFSLFLV